MEISLKSVIGSFLAIIMVLSFAACGNSKSISDSISSKVVASAGNGASTGKQKEIKTLKITMFASWYGDGWRTIENDINTNKEKLGFELDFDKIAEGEVGIQVLKARAATGEEPDILAYTCIGSFVDDLHAVDKLVDLTEYAWTKNYDNAMLKSLFGQKEKIYGIPLGGSNIPGVFYNKKVFKEIGVSVPCNWKEFLEVCEKAKAAGKVPYFVSGKDTWTVQFFSVMGWQRELKGKDPTQEAVDLMTNKRSILDYTLLKDSYAKLRELKDKGYIQKNYLSDNYDAQQRAIAEGTAAMTVNCTWIMDEIKKKFPDKLNDIGAFTVPFSGDDPVGAYIPNVVVPYNSSKNPDALKAFLEYFGSLDTQNKYFAAQPGISIVTGMDINGISQASLELYKQYSIPGRGQINWQSVPLPSDVIGPNMGNFVGYSMNVLVGTMTPDQVLQQMRKEMEKDAKTKNVAGW